jgi:hypothetical protein
MIVSPAKNRAADAKGRGRKSKKQRQTRSNHPASADAGLEIHHKDKPRKIIAPRYTRATTSAEHVPARQSNPPVARQSARQFFAFAVPGSRTACIDAGDEGFIAFHSVGLFLPAPLENEGHAKGRRSEELAGNSSLVSRSFLLCRQHFYSLKKSNAVVSRQGAKN